MTTEDALQLQIDQEPENFLLREVLADYLDEIGDERAAGYRALGLLKRRPGKQSGWYLYTLNSATDYLVSLFSSLYQTAEVWHFQFGENSGLPREWCEMISALYEYADDYWNKSAGWSGYGRTRREVEDRAATAFSKLALGCQQELLKGAASGVG